MNKILLGIVGVLIVAGGFFLLSRGSQKTTVATPAPTTQVTASPSAQQSANTVTLTANGFSPATITVKKGDTVSFVNKSGTLAQINSDPHPIHNLFPFLNLGPIADGQTLQVVIPQTGTFTYHNHLDPTERGTIIAQ